MEASSNKESVKDKIGTVIGWIVGGAFGYYTRINLLIPLGLAFLCGWIANKFIKSPLSKKMIPAFAVQMGQAFWILLAILIGYPTMVFEPILFIAVSIWMLFYPSLFPVILLTIYHAVGLIDSILKIFSFSFGTPEHKALIVHIIFRIIAVFLMFGGLREIHKQKISIEEQ